jgi:hypothetical protein
MVDHDLVGEFGRHAVGADIAFDGGEVGAAFDGGRDADVLCEAVGVSLEASYEREGEVVRGTGEETAKPCMCSYTG